jgi:hypothetical protein
VQQAQPRVSFNLEPKACIGFDQKGGGEVSEGQGVVKRVVDALGTTMDEMINPNLSGGGVRPPSQLPPSRG